MSKELKFRIWNPVLEEMSYVWKQNYLGFTGVIHSYDGCRESTWMQYTGLKDKNGKEVYESDIAKNYAGKIGLIKFGSFVSNACDCQDPRYYGWYLEYINGECLSLDDNTEQWLTIISNIHENPELLKVTSS